MPRIPDELIERIKREVPLTALVERRGVVLRFHGENLLGLCCLHPDKTPSLVVTPKKGLWHCLGACQAGGTAIDWVMRTEGVSFRHAVDVLLAEYFPLEASRLSTPKRSTVPKLASPFDAEAADEEVLARVAAYYHERLKESPDALSYLDKRGLLVPEVLERLCIGFSDRSLGLRLPLMNRKAGAEMRTKLQKLGVYRASGHEHLVGCVVFPLMSLSGAVVGMYGRRIDATPRADVPRHLYLSGPHRGLLNPEGLEGTKDLVLCEAPIDAATFFRWGFRNVTTAYGTEGFTDEILGAITSRDIERVFLAYDRDDAGDRGAEKAAVRLRAAGIECFRVRFPHGLDANAYALKVEPGDKSLGVLLRGAEWMGEEPRPPCPPRPSPTPARHDAPAVLTSPTAAIPLAASGDVASRDAAPAPPATSEGASKEENLGGPLVELSGDDEALFRFDDRRYRVQGLKKALTQGSLHVRVLAEREGDLFAPPSPIAGWFLDRFDFVSSRQRAAFEKQAAHEMGVKTDVVRWDLGRILRGLEEMQRTALAEALKPRAPAHVMTEGERAEALAFLKDEDLVSRLLADYEKCGVVGEETNKLLGYVAAVSRKLDRPLAVVVRSSSAAGKTALMEAVLSFLPKEDREKYSALSEHSLFYFEGKDFKHKVLAIVEEEGAQRASYALKLLQSEGEITIASTGKDPGTGKLVTKEYRVEGPVMIFLTTTAVEVDEELLNRALVLTVDEGREQTRRIHQLQRGRQTLEGLFAGEEKEAIYRKHHDAQRLLRPLHVVNPYVKELTFLDDRTRTRRDHTKYLTLIESIALLHQYQRPLRSETRFGKTKEYVEATLSDIALANQLASEVLGRSLDELPPQTRRLVGLLDEMVREACEKPGAERSELRFSRRDVRAFTGWSDTQVRLHLDRLVSLEYLLVHRGGRGQSFVYELLYDGQGQDGERFVIGLADVESLSGTSTSETSRVSDGTSRGDRAPFAPLPRGGRGLEEPAPRAASLAILGRAAENGDRDPLPNTYAQARRSDNGHESEEGITKPVLGRPARPYVLRTRALTKGA